MRNDVELNIEEIEWLERVCIRAVAFSDLNIGEFSENTNKEKVMQLSVKLMKAKLKYYENRVENEN